MAPPRRGVMMACARCGTEFYVRPSQTNRGRKYCGMSCRDSAYTGVDSPERFWSYVAKSDGCWEWTGKIGKNGYGVFFANVKAYPAHRKSWQMANGPIPSGMHICHHCDNKKCVRPDHLFVGTHADNMRDAWAKGIIHKPPRPVIAKGRQTWPLS